ncbi:MAG: hypothetical protein ABIQ47_13565 [Tepidiformaceae bacterium]
MVELIWDGKYDAEGRRVSPPRIALPFQTVETVNDIYGHVTPAMQDAVAETMDRLFEVRG